MQKMILPVHSAELPEGFRQSADFNLKNNTKLMIVLNVVGFFLFLGAAVLVQVYTLRVRGGSSSMSFSFEVDNLAQAGLFVLILLLDIVILVVLHEGLHGLCFWVITGKRPVFMIGPGYAAASAPGEYIRKYPYLITALCPVAVMTAAGLLAIPFVPMNILLHVTAITVLNIGGAVGDLWVAAGLLRRRGPMMVKDELDRVIFFQPVA
jgi:hypothetical protein